MSRKKPKKTHAVPEEILAEGSGPVGGASDPDAQALADALSDLATTEPAAAMSDSDVQDSAVQQVDGRDSDDQDSDDRDSDGQDSDGQDSDGASTAGTRSRPAAPPNGGAELSMSGDVDGSLPDPVEQDDAGDGVDAGVVPTSAATMDDVQLCRLVEALIFAADRPIALPRLRQLTRISDVRRIEQALATLAEQYRERGIALQQVSGGYQFRTNTSYSPWVQQLIAGRPVRLSRAQLETLAIVAYRQPITRPEIDDIRGVDSSATLRLLLDRALIRVLGKREEVGRPILYGTTKEFLDFFSLGDLRELPTLREYSELTAESRQVMSDRLGVPLAEGDVATPSSALDDPDGAAVEGDAERLDVVDVPAAVDVASTERDPEMRTEPELEVEARADLDAAEHAAAARTDLDAHVEAMTTEHDSTMSEPPQTFDPDVVEPGSEPTE